MMNASVEFAAQLDIVLVTTNGIYRLNEQTGTVKAAVELMKEQNCYKCLFDHRNATVVADTMEAYDRSDNYLRIGLEKSMRVASLVNEITTDLIFYENAAVTRGWDVKVFSDYQSALDWLNKK
jgi:hypothetical protein